MKWKSYLKDTNYKPDTRTQIENLRFFFFLEIGLIVKNLLTKKTPKSRCLTNEYQCMQIPSEHRKTTFSLIL